MAERAKLPVNKRIAVLTESGYRCAVPTCRCILALDLHHIEEVKDGGGDDVGNLIALCPTDHALYHRGIIKSESIYAYKAMLVALNGAFNRETIDLLLFIADIQQFGLIISGDGLLKFSGLIAAGLVNWRTGLSAANYTVSLSDKGRLIVNAWKLGDRIKLAAALGATLPRRAGGRGAGARTRKAGI
jgi:hypothetical protein